MKVIEIFSSVQGEGMHLGKPATFIRLSGCNLRCPWCDTKESWKNTDLEMSIEQICSTANAFDNRIVIITGGEPTIQRDLEVLTKELAKYDKYVCLETNGTNYINHDTGIDWITCSPKPESKYMIECDADEIKFVITEDFPEAVLADTCKWFKGFIWLQPNGYDMQNMWKKCYDLAMKYKGNVRVGVQLHKLMEVR